MSHMRYRRHCLSQPVGSAAAVAASGHDCRWQLRVINKVASSWMRGTPKWMAACQTSHKNGGSQSQNQRPAPSTVIDDMIKRRYASGPTYCASGSFEEDVEVLSRISPIEIQGRLPVDGQGESPALWTSRSWSGDAVGTPWEPTSGTSDNSMISRIMMLCAPFVSKKSGAPRQRWGEDGTNQICLCDK